MKLIKHRENEWKYFWINDDEVKISPSFPKETLALTGIPCTKNGWKITDKPYSNPKKNNPCI